MTSVASMTNAATMNERGDMRHIVARLERLPYCSWHLNMRLIICTAWFFDAFEFDRHRVGAAAADRDVASRRRSRSVR